VTPAPKQTGQTGSLSKRAWPGASSGAVPVRFTTHEKKTRMILGLDLKPLGG